MHTKEVGERFETASRYVTLLIRISQHEAANPRFFFHLLSKSNSEMQVDITNLVLNRAIAPSGGHILRHFARFNVLDGKLESVAKPLKIGDISVINGKVEGDV